MRFFLLFLIIAVSGIFLNVTSVYAEQIQVSSDKMQYRVGDKITISWNSINPSNVDPSIGLSYVISIYDPLGRQIISTKTDSTSASFLASGSLWQKTGQYRVEVFVYGGHQGTTSFSVLGKLQPTVQKSQILEISVLSDKNSYKRGETISISAQIKSTKELGYDATISIINPKGKPVAADQLKPRFIGSDELVASLSSSFLIDGTVWSGPGKYNATLSYGPKKASTTFDISDSDKSDRAEKIKKAKELAKKKLKEKKAKLKTGSDSIVSSDLVKTDKTSYKKGEKMTVSFVGRPIAVSIIDPSGKPVMISQGVSSPYVVVLDGPLWNVSGTYIIKVNLESGEVSSSFEFHSGQDKV